MASEQKDLAAANEPLGFANSSNPAKGDASAQSSVNPNSPSLADEAKVSAQTAVTASNNSVKTPDKLPLGWRVGENLQILLIALCLALFIRTFVAEPRFIPSESMLPTLELGDRLVVEKISYRFRAPQTGEIVVFDPPKQLQIQGYAKDQAFIKRVIGVEGNEIKVEKGKVYINEEPLKEAYIAEPPDYQWGPQIVPKGQLFVMGDNRNNSNDSHVWGFLPKRNVIGHALFRFWPSNRISRV